MSTKNLISVSISPEDLADIKAKAQELIAKLSFLLSLTPEERMGGIKLGDKTIGFVGKSVDYALNNPTLVPPYLDMEEWQKDWKLVNDLSELLRLLKPLVENIEDTITEAGIEALSAALTFYNSVKHASKNNVPGAKAIYEDLSIRFPGKGRGKGSQDTPDDN